MTISKRINQIVKYLSGIVLIRKEIVNTLNGRDGIPSLLEHDDVESIDGNLYGPYIYFIYLII